MRKAVFPLWEDLMVERKLSFTDLSKAIPIMSPQAWRRRFVGITEMTVSEASCLANFLQVPINDLTKRRD